jgi:hypothetical protein
MQRERFYLAAFSFGLPSLFAGSSGTIVKFRREL